MADDVDRPGGRDVAREVAGDGLHAVAVRRAVAVERGEHLVEARLGVAADDADDVVVGALEQPGEDLHAEEAGGAGEQDREAVRSDGRDAGHIRRGPDDPRDSVSAPSSGRSAVPSMPWIGAPIAWKPPSTWRISPVTMRARSESRKQTAPATGPASSVDHCSGACCSHRSASCEKPGMPRAAIVPIGPALTRFTRTPRGPRSRAR